MPPLPVTLATAAAAFALSWALTAAVRRYALAHAVLDQPNERSSHVVPTPRGGGLAIVSAALAGLVALAAMGIVPPRLLMAMGPGGLAIAAIGWIDDHGGVAARWRSLVHFAAAFWALWWLGGMPVLRFGIADAPVGVGGWLLGALGIVWMTNLYNFMDGIDGIAGGQAVSVGVAGAALLALAGSPSLAAVSLLLAAAAAGFLAWNWSPARIFMGDVGSGTLGYLFAVLAVASENAGAVPLMGWVVLMGVFVVDATITLVRRLLRGERVYQAHRSHAYQRAVQAGMSHGRVSALVIALNAVLGLIALAAVLRPVLVVPALLAALALLGLVYLRVERLRPMR
ncbi:MAG TPA: glycosyltransferase family 4 protein [Longimicrobiaceae bacterium]